MVSEKTGRPTPDDVVRVLFEQFCECCDLGEDGCVQIETKTICPAYYAIQFLCPDNRFALRITGKYMLCPKCNAMGMSPPDTAFNDPIQPVLVCNSCRSPLWRGRYGELVDSLEDINRSVATLTRKQYGKSPS